MRKTSDSIQRSERGALRALAAIVLSGTVAAFGCSTNRTPGYGEPARSAPAAGSFAPTPASTPGSSSASRVPGAMISSSSSPADGESAAVDALAVIKADEAFRGKNLGPASPGDNSIPSQSMMNPTGQLVVRTPAPGFYATTPPIIVGDTGVVGAIVPAGTGITAGATVAGTTTAAPTGALAATGGITGLSSTTATPILTGVGPMPAGVVTTPSAAIAGGTVGVTNLTAGVTAAPTVTRRPVIVGGTTGVASVGTGNTGGSTTAGIRVETAPNGSVVVTNSPPTLFRRFLNRIGFRRTATTTTTNPNQ